MDVEQARRRLLSLIDEHGGRLSVATVEADEQLARSQAEASAAAHALATEPEILAGEETEECGWFPFSYLIREG